MPCAGHYRYLFGKVASKAPIIIERACKGSSVADLNTKNLSKRELKNFLKAALQQRLSSDSESSMFLSQNAQKNRLEEQGKLQGSGIVQSIYDPKFEVSSEKIVASLDLIIEAGKVKTLIPAKFQVALKEVSRTKENPYGLLLNSIEAIKPEKKGKEKGKKEGNL